MAKIGLEIEGVYHIGDSTLFCSADEFMGKRSGIAKVLNSGIVSHLYISDHKGILDLDEAASFIRDEYSNIDLTVEVTSLTEIPPARARIMYNANNKTSVEIIATCEFLRDEIDQIKFEFERTCMVAPIETFALTSPEEFENDIEITL